MSETFRDFERYVHDSAETIPQCRESTYREDSRIFDLKTEFRISTFALQRGTLGLVESRCSSMAGRVAAKFPAVRKVVLGKFNWEVLAGIPAQQVDPDHRHERHSLGERSREIVSRGVSASRDMSRQNSTGLRPKLGILSYQKIPGLGQCSELPCSGRSSR